MVLYLTAQTNIKDIFIDFIALRLSNGIEISVDWDESGIDRCKEGFNARYRGVCFDGEHANGRINELEGCTVCDIQLYSDTAQNADLKITEMVFEDGPAEYIVPTIENSIFSVANFPCNG